jgi:hypothetical protein
MHCAGTAAAGAFVVAPLVQDSDDTRLAHLTACCSAQAGAAPHYHGL